MSIAELKEEFHKLVDSTTNEELLENYFRMMKFESDPENLSAIEKIEKSEKFKKEIELSLKQIEEGKVISHEEMKKRMYL